MGINSPKGNEMWCQLTIKTILTNEKNPRDKLPRTLRGKSNKNVDYRMGRVNHYLVRNIHPSILSIDQFDLIQRTGDKNTKNPL